MSGRIFYLLLFPKAYIFIITKVIGPPATAASTVAQNCGKPIVLIVIKVTRK